MPVSPKLHFSGSADYPKKDGRVEPAGKPWGRRLRGQTGTERIELFLKKVTVLAACSVCTDVAAFGNFDSNFSLVRTETGCGYQGMDGNGRLETVGAHCTAAALL